MLHRHTGFPNVCCITFGAVFPVNMVLWFLDWLLWCKFAKFLFKSCPFAENNVNTFFLKFPSKDIRESFYIRNFERFFKINWCLLCIFSPISSIFMGNVFLKDCVYNIYWKVIKFCNECIFQKFQFLIAIFEFCT